VVAQLRFASVEGKIRTCQSPDGFSTEVVYTSTGQATGDPRFTGVVTARASELVNRATGLGTAEGSFQIRDAAMDALKVKADFHGVVAAEVQHAVAVGKVLGPDGGADLYAAMRVAVAADGRPTAELGGTGADTRGPAVVQTGHCSGAFAPLSVVFP
jgi:hypothetical protein